MLRKEDKDVRAQKRRSVEEAPANSERRAARSGLSKEGARSAMSYWSKNTGTHPTSLTETDPALDTNGIVVGVHSEEPTL